MIGLEAGPLSQWLFRGEIDRTGGISRCDEMMRVMLYEAAQSMLPFKEMVLAQGLGHADREAPREKAPSPRDPKRISTWVMSDREQIAVQIAVLWFALRCKRPTLEGILEPLTFLNASI